jgi:hypothetical protein
MFLGQYRAFVTLNYDAMLPSVQTFLRQIDEGAGKDELPVERLIRAWVAFNPKTTWKIRITSMATELGKIATVLKNTTQSPPGSAFAQITPTEEQTTCTANVTFQREKSGAPMPDRRMA